MRVNSPALRLSIQAAALPFLFLTFGSTAYGQEDVTIKNTVKSLGQGLYECVVYIEASPETVRAIDDVKYTLPPNFRNRTQRVKRPREGTYLFASKPFSAAEEFYVNVKIDFKSPRKNAYLRYKLSIFNRADMQ